MLFETFLFLFFIDSKLSLSNRMRRERAFGRSLTTTRKRKNSIDLIWVHQGERESSISVISFHLNAFRIIHYIDVVVVSCVAPSIFNFNVLTDSRWGHVEPFFTINLLITYNHRESAKISGDFTSSSHFDDWILPFASNDNLSSFFLDDRTQTIHIDRRKFPRI